MIKVEAKNAIIALAIMSIFNLPMPAGRRRVLPTSALPACGRQLDHLYQNICVILNFKWYDIKTSGFYSFSATIFIWGHPAQETKAQPCLFVGTRLLHAPFHFGAPLRYALDAKKASTFRILCPTPFGPSSCGLKPPRKN